MANLRKYALETSPVADCENMHSAKIILSPYNQEAPRARDPKRLVADAKDFKGL